MFAITTYYNPMAYKQAIDDNSKKAPIATLSNRLETLVKARPDIQLLDLSGFPEINDHEIKILTQLTSLEHLIVKDCFSLTSDVLILLKEKFPSLWIDV